MNVADAERFTILWTRAQPVVAGFIRTFFPGFGDADDVLQEAALACFRKFKSYEPSRPFEAWAIGVARREILMKRRKDGRAPLLAHDGAAETLSQAYLEIAPELDERAGALRECLKGIKDRARSVLRLRYDDSRDAGDIARRLETTPGNIRFILSKARSALRECVERKLQAQEG